MVGLNCASLILYSSRLKQVMYKIVNYQLFDFFIFATHCLNIIAL